MASWIVVATLGLVIGSLLWELQRIYQVEKDVVYHHTEGCRSIDHGAKVQDLTRYGDVVFGIADDWESIQVNGAANVPSGHLLSITGLKTSSISSSRLPIRDFPAGLPFHPRGFYLYSNSTLYILNSACDSHGTRIEVVNITSSGLDISAVHAGFIALPHNLHGKIGDLVVTTPSEFYLSQYTAEEDGTGSIWSRVLRVVGEVVGKENTYVHRCTYVSGKTAACSALNGTAAVSVTGIAKDKFGSYFVAYSSVDYNWIGVYERKEHSGELVLRNKVPVRDMAEKIDWDEGWQRTYGGAMPYPYSSPVSPLTPGGIIEMKLWDFRSGYIYRSLVMQDGSLLQGATCAARQGDFFLWASQHDTKIVVCPVISSGN